VSSSINTLAANALIDNSTQAINWLIATNLVLVKFFAVYERMLKAKTRAKSRNVFFGTSTLFHARNNKKRSRITRVLYATHKAR